MLPEPEVVRLYVYYIKTCPDVVFSMHSFSFQSDHGSQRYNCMGNFAIMRIFPELEGLSEKCEKSFLLFIFYISCANFSSVAVIFASES